MNRYSHSDLYKPFIHPITININFYSFPGATNETLLQKFNTVHKDNKFYKKPQKKEAAFIVEHYAGKVKYQVKI